MTSMPYSRFDWEDQEHPSEGRGSIQIVPVGASKKALFVLFLVAGTVLLTFYKRSPKFEFSDNEKAVQRSESLPQNTSSTVLGSQPTWTWTCEDDHCVRSQATETETTTVQSFKTCNMLCLASPLWPEPNIRFNLSKTIVPLKLTEISLQIVKYPSEEVAKHIKGAFELLKKDLNKIDKHKDVTSSCKNIVVRVLVNTDKDPRLFLNTTESYKVNVKTLGDKVTVTAEAESFVGARHALETFAQLIWFDTTRETLVAYEAADVEDAPKFYYRGLLLDTARNYFPVEDIIRTLDAMAASKLNTFHWHATDSQSFPLKLNSTLQLALNGAYSLREVYTVDDVKYIVHHARLRGIRVVIEIDTPSHVGRGWSWAKEKFGDLAYCVEASPWNRFCGEPPCGQLNPTNDNVYTILEKIYEEIIQLTGVDDVFHIGGDEVNNACWRTHIKKSNPMQLWADFTKTVVESLTKANNGQMPKMTILWSSPLTRGTYLNFMKNFTIQLWGGPNWNDIRAIPNAGIKSIFSHVDAWYLDCGFGSWRSSSDSHCTYRSWKVAYNHRPWKDKNWPLAGGEVCMWSELVGSGGLDSRVWPRAAAFAERIWSDPDHEVRVEDFIRLDLHRQRLIERGIGAEPVWSHFCTQNPYECFDSDLLKW